VIVAYFKEPFLHLGVTEEDHKNLSQENRPRNLLNTKQGRQLLNIVQLSKLQEFFSMTRKFRFAPNKRTYYQMSVFAHSYKACLEPR
jgi:hypothetical protein